MKYIFNCKDIFYFEQMRLCLICKVMWVWGCSCDIILWEGSFWFSKCGLFFIGLCSLLELLLTQKINQQHTCLIATTISNHPPPTQVCHDLTCFFNCRLDDWEEADQDENRGGVFCKGKGSRHGGENKGEKKQEDD